MLLDKRLQQCVVPENIHTHPTKGHWREGEVALKPKIFKGKYGAKLVFPVGCGVGGCGVGGGDLD